MWFLLPKCRVNRGFSRGETMGRGRGKGKRQSAVASHEDLGSGEEEKIPASKRRGRPTKPLKDDIEDEEEEAEKMEEDGDEFVSKRDVKNQSATENGKKKRKPAHAKENDSVKEENGVGPKSSLDGSTRTVGFRQNGSRRKNKPRRAAEAGVECK